MSDLDAVPDDAVPDGVDLARGEAELRAATRQLLDAPPSPRAVEVADRVLMRALAAPRRALLVRAAPPREYLRVSSLVVIALVRERLDPELRGAAVRRVLLDVDRDERLTAVTVELVVQYGTVVADVGGTARDLTRQVLVELLGLDPASPGPAIAVTNAHVSDVTSGDPHLVDPLDEGRTPGP